MDYITPGIRLRPDPAKVRILKRTQQSAELHSRSVRPDYVEKNAVLPSNLPPLNLTVCDQWVTPECIRGKPSSRALFHQDKSLTAIIAQYSVPEGKRAAPGNELGIFESLNDHYSKQDLDDYWSAVYP